MSTLESLRIEIIKLLKETLKGKKVIMAGGTEATIVDYLVVGRSFKLTLSDNSSLDLYLDTFVVFDFGKDKVTFLTSAGRPCTLSD